MGKIELSVVIVNYKSWRLLENCINSFEKFPPSVNYETIIIDNDSQDGMFDDFSALYPDIKFIRNKGNYGFSNGCNLGASYAEGRYLLFLNPDTELTEDKAIDEMVRFIRENNSTGLVSCRTISPKSVERELLFTNPWLLIGFVRQLYKFFNKKQIKEKFHHDAKVWYPDWVAGSVVLIEHQLFNEVGRWNEERYWMYHEDPDICIKVKESGKKIALLRNVSIKHVGGGTSRKDTTTSIMSKTEVVVSSHNYIQANTKIAPSLLHLLFGLVTLLALLLKAIFSVLILKGQKAEIYALTAVAVLKFYFLALGRRTWKSSKLDNIHNKYCSSNAKKRQS